MLKHRSAPPKRLRCSNAAASPIIDGSVSQAESRISSTGTVLDDITSETVDATHILRRVDDRGERLNGLYVAIGDWLPDGWEACRGAPGIMHEELMRKFGIAAKRMPTFELLGRSGDRVKFEPRALWIIGGNDRVDLKRKDRRYLIFDRSENFARPNWRSACAEQCCDRETVTRKSLKRILQ